jgi:serralysin
VYVLGSVFGSIEDRRDTTSGGDLLYGGAGSDTLNGGTGADTMFGGAGNALANDIQGNAGANDIDGKQGNDTLTGKGGADHFVFTTALNGTKNVDKITDFVDGTDVIVLENAMFAAVGVVGGLAAGRFAINAPGDANDVIIYNTTTGALSYDADGNGAGVAIHFADLTGVPGITQADFPII